MGKSIKSIEKYACKVANKRLQMVFVEEAVAVSSNITTSGQRRGYSSTQNLALGKPVEEQSPISNLTIQLAPAAPGFDVEDSTKIYPPHQREVVVSANLILPKSKKITKSKVSGNRNISSEQILELSNIQPTTTTNNTGRANDRVAKVNHRKYTVKTPSNYLRKQLKKYGFNFERYEGKGHNKRGTSIYLNLLLLELRIRKRQRFPEFVENYKRQLYRLIAKQKQLQKQQGLTEKSEKYIEYFEKAIIAADKFVRGNYYGSIKIYFGIGKEEFYLSEGVQFFIKRKDQLRDNTLMIDKDQDEEELFDVLNLKD